MRHLKAGRKLKRTHSHRKALLRNMATSLFEHKRIATTEAKAKELRPYAEQIITRAKKALQREKAGLLPEGQTVDVHARRVVGKTLMSKAVIQELFDTIAPMVEDRPGGYTRIIKTGFRRGDGGRTAIIELVDWSEPQDGAGALKKNKKKSAPKPQAEKPAEVVAEAPEAPATDEVTEVVEEVVEAKTDETEVVDEAPVAEAPAEEEVKAEEKPAKENKKADKAE
jgi:large subunit ribosomal protein L17